MTREDISNAILNINHKSILLELGTGIGKSRQALLLIDKYLKQVPEDKRKVLIVYPKINLKQNWIDEIKKWQMEYLLSYITFTTYNSLYKYVISNNKSIEYIVSCYDEGHHLSNLKRDIVSHIHSKYNIILSATVNRNLKAEFRYLFNDLYIYSINAKTAIDNDILAEPTAILIPLKLEDIKEPQEWIINPKAKYTNDRHWDINKNNYWLIKKQGSNKYRYVMKGTVVQYNQLQESLIEFYKNRQSNIILKTKYLRMCGARLAWYANLRNNIILSILNELKNYKTLTFCTNIEQSNILGKNAIHSKNKKSNEILDKFNSNKIKHITAVDKLTEGQNLSNCKIGIWARYNGSELMSVQKIGRILRHKHPYLILPYFVNTREEDIVKSMLNISDKVIVTTVDKIKEHIK